jgi:hypothetical protein
MTLPPRQSPGVFHPQLQGRACTLGRITAVPVRGIESPADLDARREVRLEARGDQANESREGGDSGHLDGPEPESMALEGFRLTVVRSEGGSVISSRP